MSKRGQRDVCQRCNKWMQEARKDVERIKKGKHTKGQSQRATSTECGKHRGWYAYRGRNAWKEAST